MIKRNMIDAIILFMLCVMFAGGCTIQARPDYSPSLTEQGRIYFYLQPLPQEMLPLGFTISDIAAVSKDGSMISLIDNELTVTGSEQYDSQTKLFAKTLEPGRYKGISLRLSKAVIATEEGDMDLLPPEQPLHLNLDFTVHRGRSLALFLTLSPEYLISNGFKFTPRFVLAKPHLHPKNYLGFISNTAENIITVFNKMTMEIVQIISTGSGPKGMALDQKNGMVYVALAGDDAIGLISVDSMEVTGRIRLLFGDEPSEVALSPDGRSLIVANYGSGTVSIIDTRSKVETARIRVDPEPGWVVTGRERQLAYILHPLANSITIINVDGQRQHSSITLEESPWRAALNRDSSSLYIVPEHTSGLKRLDPRTRTITNTIYTGGSNSAITVDTRNDLVYIGRNTGEIVVIDPSAGMFIDNFTVPGAVGFMTIDGEENVLLVLSQDLSTLYKINLVSKKELAHAAMEKGAHELVVMGEL